MTDCANHNPKAHRLSCAHHPTQQAVSDMVPRLRKLVTEYKKTVIEMRYLLVLIYIPFFAVIYRDGTLDRAFEKAVLIMATFLIGCGIIHITKQFLSNK